MKKVFSTLLIAGLLSSSIAFGASVLLTNATTTGAGTYAYVNGARDHAVVATFANASTLTIALEHSLDRTTWTQLGSYPVTAADIAAGKARFHVNDRLTDYVRPNITALTGGGATATVSVLSK